MSTHQVFTFDEPTDVYVSHPGGNRLMITLKSQGETVDLDINVDQLYLTEDVDTDAQATPDPQPAGSTPG